MLSKFLYTLVLCSDSKSFRAKGAWINVIALATVMCLGGWLWAGVRHQPARDVHEDDVVAEFRDGAPAEEADGARLLAIRQRLLTLIFQ